MPSSHLARSSWTCRQSTVTSPWPTGTSGCWGPGAWECSIADGRCGTVCIGPSSAGTWSKQCATMTEPTGCRRAPPDVSSPAARTPRPRPPWRPGSTARRFQPGRPNPRAQEGLSARLEILLEVGLGRIQEALQQRTAYLIQSIGALPGARLLSPATPERRAGIVTFSFAGIDSQWLYQRLMQAGVVCAARGGGVRWSPHFYTSQEVLDRALGILRGLLQEARGS